MNVQTFSSSLPSSFGSVEAPSSDTRATSSDDSGTFADQFAGAMSQSTSDSDGTEAKPNTATLPAKPSQLPDLPYKQSLSLQDQAANAAANFGMVAGGRGARTPQPIEGIKTAKKTVEKTKDDDVNAGTSQDMADLSLAALNSDLRTRAQSPAQTDAQQPTTGALSKQVNDLDPTASMKRIETSAPASGDLALAMRISATTNDSDAAAGEPPVVPPATPVISATSTSALHATTNALVHAVEHQGKEQSETSSWSNEGGNADNRLASNLTSTTGTKDSESTKSTDFDAELSKANGEPVKSAHVQIGDENSGKIDIRLVERAGSLSVSVRSTDSSLTKTLADHTTELTTRLSADHYKTELWAAGGRDKNNSDQGGSSSKQGERHAGSPNDDSAKRQNSQANQKQNQDPDWVHEFEKLPGTFQQRISYTWPQ